MHADKYVKHLPAIVNDMIVVFDGIPHKSYKYTKSKCIRQTLFKFQDNHCMFKIFVHPRSPKAIRFIRVLLFRVI